MLIRPLTEADLPAAAALEAACFSDAWSKEALLLGLKAPGGYYLAAEEEGRLMGCLAAQTVLDEGELLRLAVSPAARQRGIGDALLKRMLADCPDIGVWRLDVRVSNRPAIHLYENNDFRILCENRDFYRQPRENGYLMMRNLC